MTEFFVSDVDGTLLNSSGALSEASRAELHKLLANGLPFTVASARSIVSLRALFGDLPFSFPVVEINGAFITDYKTGEHLQINALPSELCQAVYERILELGFRPFVLSFNGVVDRLHYDQLSNEAMVWYEARRRKAADPRLVRTPALHTALSEQVVSLTVMAHDPAGIRALRAALLEEFGDALTLFCMANEYNHGSWWLTIHHPKASKHVAVRTLLSEVGVTHLTAFGDNANDLELLQKADHGVAVENAIPEVLAAADEVIGHQDQDAVVQYLSSRQTRH